MHTPAQLFRLLNELVFVLLGLLLLLVAISGRFLFFNRRSVVWVGLGAFLVYYGLRAWWKARGLRVRREVATAAVRAGSLALLGAMMLAIAWVPFRYIAPLLGVAGGILALRGLVSAVLVSRVP